MRFRSSPLLLRYQDRAEVVDVGQRRAGHHLIPDPFEEAMRASLCASAARLDRAKGRGPRERPGRQSPGHLRRAVRRRVAGDAPDARLSPSASAGPRANSAFRTAYPVAAAGHPSFPDSSSTGAPGLQVRLHLPRQSRLRRREVARLTLQRIAEAAAPMTPAASASAAAAAMRLRRCGDHRFSTRARRGASGARTCVLEHRRNRRQDRDPQRSGIAVASAGIEASPPSGQRRSARDRRPARRTRSSASIPRQPGHSSEAGRPSSGSDACARCSSPQSARRKPAARR